MAENSGEESLEERTEEATETRRQDFKREGNVVQSREVGGALVLLALTAVLYGGSAWSAMVIKNLFVDTLAEMGRLVSDDWSIHTVMMIAQYALRVAGLALA